MTLVIMALVMITLSIMIISIMTLSKMGLFATLKINGSQHNDTQRISIDYHMLSDILHIVMLSVVFPNVLAPF